MDEFIGFSWFDILIPGVSTWEPLAVTFGIVSFWTMAVVSLTFYVKKWIGQTRWRNLHYLSFGVFVAGTGHGLLAGTDTTHPAAIATYTIAVTSVFLLTTVRIIGSREPTPRRTSPPTVAAD